MVSRDLRAFQPMGGSIASPRAVASQIQPLILLKAVHPLMVVSPTSRPEQDVDAPEPVANQ